MQKYLFLILLGLSFGAWSQETGEVHSILKTLRGKIIDGSTQKALSNTHIINLNSVTATISNSSGDFGINVQVNDTLYFSYVGYQSIKLKVTHDLLKGNDLEISMYETPVELSEVKLKPYKLIGVLEVDAKLVPIDKFERIHISGLPQTFETGAPVSHVYNKPTDAIFHPIDFMYELFGKKPQQLKKLQKLKTEDDLRELLEEKANREVLMEYLEMDKEQLNSLLDYCNYSDYFIRNATDLQIIEAVLECYENFKALKNGSTQKERITE
jgi:hypothetical protein